MREEGASLAAAVRDRYGLSGRQQHQLDEVVRLLEVDEHAPTAIREPERVAALHLADSLAALELDLVRSAAQIADLGSGAGFPGVALAIALPAATVSLVESQSRKCRFLETLCVTAALENATVVCARAEAWPDGTSRHDLVVARALAPQPVVLEYAAPLLRAGGSLVDWRGRREPREEEAAARAAEELGLAGSEIHRVEPFEGARDRHLHVFVKVAETPERFPRRPGMARKRPLGGRARGQ
jgi:16S rRNA (guanine527-N7)-methyltransferase